MERHIEIERSIIKKYRRDIWKPFVAAINQYQLLQEGDKIAVCISGGKDSMLMAKCFQELQKHGKMQFELVFLMMDPGYHPKNRALILTNADILHIPLTIFETDIFNIVEAADGSPCYLCARMRRGYLYKNAQQLGCNKIALGHHFDDVIETILMSMLYGAEIRTMMPKLHSTNFAGMQLIRPMYQVKEASIIAWARHHHLEFIQCACRFTEMCAKDEQAGQSKRLEMKQLIQTFRKTSPYIEKNIFRSVEHVNLDTLIGYRSAKTGSHSFLDAYDELQSEDLLKTF